MSLISTLQLILSQRLVPLKAGTGRILALEKLANSTRIKQLIREEKTHQIRTQMTSAAADYVSLEAGLAKLCNRGLITEDAGKTFAEDEIVYKQMLRELST